MPTYSLARSNVIRGPAVIIINDGSTSGTTNDAYVFSQGDIRVEFGHTTFDVTNSAFGIVDKRTKERSVKISFTPVGNISTALANIFWPYITYNFQPGDSALKRATAQDPYVTVIPKSGAQYQFFGAVVSKSPEVMLAADKTQIGQLEITAIGKQGVDWSASGTDGPTGTGSLYTAQANTYATALTTANFTVASIKTGPYVGTYGTTIGSGNAGTFSTNAGFTVGINTQMQPVETDEFGLFDFTVGDIVATATCAPLDVSADQISAAIPMQTAARGASLQSNINLLIDVPSGLTGTGLIYSTLTNASVFQTGWAFGTATQRIPQLTFTTVRQFSSGSLGAPASISIH
jgi:hypothetical protein